MQEVHDRKTIEAITGTICNILTDYYAQPEKDPVLAYRTKKEILEEINEVEPPQEGIGLDQTLLLFKEKVLQPSVKTWHPLFFNQMFAGASLTAIVGDLMASMMNPTLATWEMAPTATVIERNVTQWMAKILGMRQGSSGIILPGGSLGNLLALTVARNQRLDPEIASKGVHSLDQGGAILCSEAAHYSITNAGNLLGIGLNQVFKVKTNDRDEMVVDDFVAKLAECDRLGLKPFVVVATMGVTVTGGFDPLDDLVEICRKRDLHLHVDAAFGGGMALTRQGPTVFKGIEHADTVVWDAHKWLHVPLTCTVLLAPDARIFKHTFSSNADYLFHPQEEEIDQADDLGHYTLLCGKRFDALRVWILFKAFGETYFREMADDRVAFTEEVYRLLAADPDFVPSYEPVSPIVCFRFLPEKLRGTDPAYQNKLHRWVREEAKKRGTALFNITKLKGMDHFRMILINPLTHLEHITAMFDDLRRLAREFMSLVPIHSYSP